MKKRLDVLLVERGLAESRAQAQALVMAGRVPGFEKAGQQVDDAVELALTPPPPFVSRGGEKLDHALDVFGIVVAGRRCLDVGASTGGFTDVLLQRGARRVVALDVGYGDLDWRLRNHPRVTVRERLNARRLTPEALPYRPDLIAVDVSFISLTKVLPAVLDCAAGRYDCLALCKPQFEVGRRRVGSGGVVREPHDRRTALLAVAGCAQRLGAAVIGFVPSGLPGPKGNVETFVWLGEAGRAGARDLQAAAREADP
jgi:23S rRNA (cytidine1920-2'-O)/16S rRNA (cytidine1409-2'-O)-methyltransferase